MNRFAKLDSEFCYPRRVSLDEYSEYAHYCFSQGNWNVYADLSVRIFVFFRENIKECPIDYRGHFLPASIFEEHLLPIKINQYNQISYDINDSIIYFFENHMIYRFKDENGTSETDKTSLYQLSFDVASIEYDYSNSQMFLLDKKNRFFVISFNKSYIKLLSTDVISFKFHLSTM
ncbi:hypothetical protein RF11_16349 [Thelohanellus kitauei]|uniref:Uncharacterized protein n=1 Tax=Thelohanellus kitauei TaxID=669202 RepID=A0A0C2J399_THEKT|nr:hypothetical protein RF11_16349 [Thelohanellus kitauei]